MSFVEIILVCWLTAGVIGMAINGAKNKNIWWGFLGGFFFGIFGWLWLAIHRRPT